MDKILLNKTETYVVDNDAMAEELIADAKEKASQEGYELKKYSSQKKEKTSKGEVIASYVVVQLVKEYDKEKDLF